MSSLDPNAKLADIVTAQPVLASHLDRLGLDYCCGGQSRLVDAVNSANLDLNTVVSELEIVGSERGTEDWSAMSPAALVDHLEATHHAYLRESLPRLTELADKVTSVHSDHHPELIGIQRLLADLRADLEPHLLKEERILFPMIRELGAATTAPNFHCGSLNNPIRVMSAEHDIAGELLAALRTATNDFTPPRDGCASYHAFYAGLAELEADTHLHVHKENNLLFPAALEIEHRLAASE